MNFEFSKVMLVVNRATKMFSEFRVPQDMTSDVGCEQNFSEFQVQQDMISDVGYQQSYQKCSVNFKFSKT